MPEIVIERIRLQAGSDPCLIEQVNQLIEEIRLAASRSFRGTRSGVTFDRWLRSRRDQFWACQFELIEDEFRFKVRMAVPNCEVEELRAIVTREGIDVRSTDGSVEYDGSADGPEPSKLIRRVELSSPIDATTVTALVAYGELKLSGAKVAMKVRKRARAAGG